MKERLKRMYADYKYALGLALLLVVSAGAVQFLVQERLSDFSETLRGQITEQEAVLITIAKATAPNAADVETEGVIRDCAVDERTEFDGLLGRLDAGLSATELTKLERLFGRCGDYFAVRKSVMVARLDREVEVYASLVAQLETLTKKNEEEMYRVDIWRQLAEEEQKLSGHFSQLVVVQDNIITTLLSGKNAESQEIKDILREAQETQGMLIVTSKQVATVRDTLLPL